MNEKLKNTLLFLRTKPLNAVQRELEDFSPEETSALAPWEKDLKNSIKTAPTTQWVFQRFFSLVPEKNRKNVSNLLVKPIFLAQATLPANQREPDFYQFIYNSSQRYQWDESVDRSKNNNKSWLTDVLFEINFTTLATILNQASQEEFNFLFNHLKENQSPEQFHIWLKNLPIIIWNVLFSKLSLEDLRKINLLEIIKDSVSARHSLADYLIKIGPNQKAWWELVQEKQLLTVEPFLKILSKDQGTSQNFDEFLANFKGYKKRPNELWIKVFRPLLEPLTAPIIQTFNLREQMIAYILLATHIGHLKLNLNEKSETAVQDLESAQKTLEDYKRKSPFLTALSAARVLPDNLLEEYLTMYLEMTTGEIKAHLELAGWLPHTKRAEHLKAHAKANASQPQPSSSSRMLNVQPPAYARNQEEDPELAAALEASLQENNNFDDEDESEEKMIL